MPFEYFFDYQSGQFDFIRIPRVMMTEEVFAPLSMQAKIMYGMLLDRMKLSYKNKWVDEENKGNRYYGVSSEDIEKKSKRYELVIRALIC